MEESTNFFNAEFDEGKTGDDDDEEMSREMMGFKIGCDDRVLNVMGVMYKSRYMHMQLSIHVYVHIYIEVSTYYTLLHVLESHIPNITLIILQCRYSCMNIDPCTYLTFICRYNTEPRFHLNWARSIANMLVRHMKGLQAIMNIYLYRRPYSSDDCTIHGASSLMLSESTGKTYSSIVSKGTGKGNIKKLPATEISDIGKKGLLEHVTAYRKRSLKARANPWVNYDWIGLYPGTHLHMYVHTRCVHTWKGM